MNAPPEGGADATSAPIDLTGVDPIHWAQTRERVAILRAWCAVRRHPRAEAVAAAGRMGVTVSHFYRLVATWKRHRDARRVSGYPSRRGDERAPKSMPADARAAMQRVVTEAGTEARFTDVLAAVRTACAAIGARPPSSGMVHREMMRARQQPVANAGGAVDDIALTVVSCLLPVTSAGRTIDAPDLLLAVERSGGRVIGHRLVLDGDWTSGARDMLADLATTLHTPITVSSLLADVVPKRGRQDEQPPTEAGRHGVGVAVTRRATLLSKTLGNYIDSIPIRHRRVTSRSPGPWTPLTAGDARAAIDLAIAAHNAARRA